MSDLAMDGGPKAVTASMDDSWREVSDLERRYVDQVLDAPGSAYAQLDLFDEAYRKFVGSKHALCMCNGTAALHSAMFAVGARAGKEVIVPTATWHATITPILHCNATPVFCEIDPQTFCADPEDVKKRITPRTCAIVVTHLYGNPADMDAFLEIVAGTDIALIEDASHAHGAMWENKMVGNLGHIGCFSMQEKKPVSGLEAGVATTNDDDLYDRMLALGQSGRCDALWQTDRFRALRNMGLGVKYRANPLGIAMARAQLERLPMLNEKRLAWFNRMDDLLAPIPGVIPQQTYPKATRGGMLLYSGTVDPDAFGAPLSVIVKALVAEGVSISETTAWGYSAMHLEPLFLDFSFEGLGGPWGDLPPDARRPRCDLPVSEALQATSFWLATPVAPCAEWVEQTAHAFAKVVAHRDRLSEIAKEYSP